MANRNRKEYRISSDEVARRIKAFNTLLFSLAIGLIISSLDLFLYRPLGYAAVVAAFALLLWWTRVLMKRFFHNFSQSKIFLTKRGLVRTGRNSQGRFRWSQVRSIHGTRKVLNEWRSVSFLLNNGRKVQFNGLEDFEGFMSEAIRHLAPAEQSPPLHHRAERLNYDHPLFYLILGLCLGAGTIQAGRISSLLVRPSALTGVLAGAFLMLGVYWWVAAPLTTTYGSAYRRTDSYSGGFLLAIGLGLWAFFLLSA